jgi:phage baseplate assembly protein W
MDTNLQKSFEIRDIGSNKIEKEILPIIDVNGDFKEVRGKDAIVTKIRNLLMTPLGTYPFDPEYGSLLHKQIFEMADDITEKQIYYEVNDRILKYIDGIRIDSVNLVWSNDKKTCYVDVYVFVLDDINRTKISLEVQNYGNSMYGTIDDPVYGDYMF